MYVWFAVTIGVSLVLLSFLWYVRRALQQFAATTITPQAQGVFCKLGARWL